MALSTHEPPLVIPKPKSINKMELYQDVKTFVCKLRLQYLTYDRPAKLPIPFKPKFKVNPTTTVNDTLETFIEKTKVELMSLDLKQNVKDNLTKNERIVLSNLTQRTDIVINKADKGSTIVILTRSTYIHRGMNHLADEATYEPLLEDISGELKTNINHQLHKLYTNGLLTEPMYKFYQPPL